MRFLWASLASPGRNKFARLAFETFPTLNQPGWIKWGSGSQIFDVWGEFPSPEWHCLNLGLRPHQPQRIKQSLGICNSKPVENSPIVPQKGFAFGQVSLGNCWIYWFLPGTNNFGPSLAPSYGSLFRRPGMGISSWQWDQAHFSACRGLRLFEISQFCRRPCLNLIYNCVSTWEAWRSLFVLHSSTKIWPGFWIKQEALRSTSSLPV